jgi:hypothetical protein
MNNWEVSSEEFPYSVVFVNQQIGATFIVFSNRNNEMSNMP